LALPSCCSN
jgi:hypothetical protein